MVSRSSVVRTSSIELKFEIQPVTITVEPAPLMTTVEVVRFPETTVVVAPAGIASVGVSIEPIEVQIPPTQTKEAEGRAEFAHVVTGPNEEMEHTEG